MPLLPALLASVASVVAAAVGLLASFRLRHCRVLSLAALLAWLSGVVGGPLAASMWLLRLLRCRLLSSAG
eukprot:15441326-Alexandrium_andersonii.AAC.1